MSRLMEMIFEKRGLPKDYINMIEHCQDVYPTDTEALCRELKKCMTAAHMS